MKCPKCSAEMEKVMASQQEVDRCTGCGGLWFDLREHEHIAESKAAVKKLDTGDAAKGKAQDAKRDIDCPVCHVRMLKLSVPGQPHIHYESCPLCFGAFFDAGEFTDYATLTLGERMKRFFAGFRRKK